MDPDYVAWAQGIDPIGKAKAAYDLANDQYAGFANKLAGRQIAQGNYAGAAAALGGAGNVQSAQALQEGAQMQTALTAEGNGDVAGARTAAAATGNQGSYDAAQSGAQQTAMLRQGALSWIAGQVKNIPQAPTDAAGDPSTPRAQYLRGVVGSGMLSALGVSPQTSAKLGSLPLTDTTLQALATNLPYSGTLKGDGGVETAYVAGDPVAHGYTAPVKLESAPGKSESLYDPTKPGAPPIASSTAAPQLASPGQVPVGPNGPTGPAVPYPLTVTANSQTGGVNVTNPNLSGAGAGAPSPSPVSAGMVKPNGASGVSGGDSNNPYNLHSPLEGGVWNGQVGANPNGVANFDSAASSQRAMDMTMGAYARHGITTPQAFVQRYASSSPPNEQAAYVARLTAAVGPQFDLNNPNTRAAVEGAVRQQEGVTAPSPIMDQGGAVPGPGQSLQQGGASYQSGTLNGVAGQYGPNGKFDPNPAANVDFSNIAGAKEKIYNNDEVKQAMASAIAYKSLTANAGKLTGPAAYNIIDTWIRTINPGRAATVGAIQAAAEQLGMTTEALGHILSATQKGGLPLNIQQQIADGVLPFAQGHYDQAAKVVKSYTEAARAYGGDKAANAVNVDIGSRPNRFVIGAIPAPAQRQEGSVYNTPKGNFQWRGGKWYPQD